MSNFAEPCLAAGKCRAEPPYPLRKRGYGRVSAGRCRTFAEPKYGSSAPREREHEKPG
jgi:hypothetical protein